MHCLRLALIAHRFQKNDGQGRVNYEVARRAAAMGHHVTLLTAHCAPELASEDNVEVVLTGAENLPSQLLRDMAFAGASSAWIRKHRRDFDIVQANGFTTWQRCDIVTAHFVHTAWARSKWYPFRGSLKPQSIYQRVFTSINAVCERLVFRRAGKVIAVSDAVAREVEELHVSRSKVEVVYNGVDVEEYSPGPSQRVAFALPEGVPMALFVGDIRTTRKNLDTTLLALQQIAGLHLAVAGDVEGSPFPAMAHRLGLQDRVHFLGKTSAIPALMRSADLFVFPSRYEAHPLVVLEAMASGLPSVIASTVGSVSSFRECFSVLENPDDVDELATRIKLLLNDADQRRRLGEAARAMAESFTWDRTVAQYVSIYQDTVKASSIGFRGDLSVELGRQ